MDQNYQLGKLIFTIKGEDKILPHLYKELKSITYTGSEKPDIVFNFAPPSKQIKNGIYVSPIVCSSTELLFNDKSFNLHMENKGHLTHVNIQSKPVTRRENWFPKLARFKNWNYLLPAEQGAKNFMYEVFDYITQIKNLEKRQSYIHASSFKKDGKAIAVIAWGGVGKTTSMLKLVQQDGWKFLSDDLGIIDADGFVYRSPKKMQIYAYNLENEPAFRNILLGGRGALDRLNWFILKHKKGLHGVRRRVSAEELFGETAVEKCAKLTTAFFVERAAIKEMTARTISTEELAQRSAIIIMREINPFQTIETAVHSALKESIIPYYDDLFQQTKLLLKNAFSNVNNLVLLQIPQKTTPNELANYVRTSL